jgi:hypothetical protein
VVVATSILRRASLRATANLDPALSAKSTLCRRYSKRSKIFCRFGHFSLRRPLHSAGRTVWNGSLACGAARIYQRRQRRMTAGPSARTLDSNSTSDAPASPSPLAIASGQRFFPGALDPAQPHIVPARSGQQQQLRLVSAERRPLDTG